VEEDEAVRQELLDGGQLYCVLVELVVRYPQVASFWCRSSARSLMRGMRTDELSIPGDGCRDIVAMPGT
jgi:hypothetical protein